MSLKNFTRFYQSQSYWESSVRIQCDSAQRMLKSGSSVCVCVWQGGRGRGCVRDGIWTASKLWARADKSTGLVVRQTWGQAHLELCDIRQALSCFSSQFLRYKPGTVILPIVVGIKGNVHKTDLQIVNFPGYLNLGSGQLLWGDAWWFPCSARFSMAEGSMTYSVSVVSAWGSSIQFWR